MPDRPRAPRAPLSPKTGEVSAEIKVGATDTRIAQMQSMLQQRIAEIAKAEVDGEIKLAKAKQSHLNAKKLEDFQGGLAQLEQEALQSSLQNAHNIQQLGREVGSFRPRPGRLFHDSSGAAMWGAAMSLAAGAFQSERSGGPNTAMAIIDTAIKQDLAAQEIQYDAMKTELQANQTLYSQMRASYGDAIVARKAQGAALREAAAARLQAAGREFLPQQAKLAGDIAAEKQIQLANKELIEVAEKTFTIRSTTAAGKEGERLMSLLPAPLQDRLLQSAGRADLRILGMFGEEGVALYQQEAEREKLEGEGLLRLSQALQKQTEVQVKQGTRPPAAPAPRAGRAPAPRAAAPAPSRAQAPLAAPPPAAAEEPAAARTAEQIDAEIQDAQSILEAQDGATILNEETRETLAQNVAKRVADLEAEKAQLAAASEEQQAQIIESIDKEMREAAPAIEADLKVLVSTRGGDSKRKSLESLMTQSREGNAVAIYAQTAFPPTAIDRSVVAALLPNSDNDERRRQAIETMATLQDALGGTVNLQGEGGAELLARAQEIGRGAFLNQQNLRFAGKGDVGALSALRQSVDLAAIPTMFGLSGIVRQGKFEFADLEDARIKAEKQMGVGGERGMGLKVVRRPVTLTVPSRIWDLRVNDGNGGWVDSGRPPAEVTINMPVLASAQLTFDDKSIGQDFIPQLAGKQQQVKDYRAGGGDVTPIGESPAQRAGVRETISQIQPLSEYAQGLLLYGSIMEESGRSVVDGGEGGFTAGSEWAAGAQDDLNPETIMAGWRRAVQKSKALGLATLHLDPSTPPLLYDKKTEEWRVNPKSEVAREIGLARETGFLEGGDEFEVTQALMSGNIATLSHFVGFMAPQNAEMKLLEAMTGQSATGTSWYDIRSWNWRTAGRSPERSALAFMQFLDNKADSIYESYTVPAAGMQQLYQGAIGALNGAGKQRGQVDWEQLTQAARRNE
ncbi:MAG: hypothetical protein GY812_02425 [Actinomycetia bacterium]|nr:hypothetical protein [Actinomycetes bacterium]